MEPAGQGGNDGGRAVFRAGVFSERPALIPQEFPGTPVGVPGAAAGVFPRVPPVRLPAAGGWRRREATRKTSWNGWPPGARTSCRCWRMASILTAGRRWPGASRCWSGREARPPMTFYCAQLDRGGSAAVRTELIYALQHDKSNTARLLELWPHGKGQAGRYGALGCWHAWMIPPPGPISVRCCRSSRGRSWRHWKFACGGQEAGELVAQELERLLAPLVADAACTPSEKEVQDIQQALLCPARQDRSGCLRGVPPHGPRWGRRWMTGSACGTNLPIGGRIARGSVFCTAVAPHAAGGHPAAVGTRACSPWPKS